MTFITTPAATHPDKEAVVCGEVRYTHKQLVENTEKLAGGLRDLGITQGDRIAWFNVNAAEGGIVFFACAKLGVGFVPLNYRSKAEEVHFLLADSGVKAVFVGAQYIELIRSIQSALPENLQYIALPGATVPEGWHSYESLLQSEPMPENADVNAEELGVLLYTSGTTARPKGVRLTYGDLMAYIRDNAPAIPPAPTSTTVVGNPICHVAGFFPMISLPYNRARLVWIPQFEPGLWLKTVEQEKVTSAFLVPTMMKQVLDHPNFATTNLNSLMGLAYGAAPMPLSVIERAIRSFPKHCVFTQAYGQTESSATVAILGPDDHKIGETPAELEQTRRRLRSIGKAMPNTEIRIADENGDTVPPNTVGEIAIRAERVMQGYDRQEEATRNTLKNGWLHTRDMGWMDEDGYIYLAGRKSDMIIRGGENIAPEEIEQVLYTHEAVGECAVIGIPDEEWGEKVAAIVVLNPGFSEDADALREHCRTRLASFKKPEIIRFVAELPHNSTGKVLKKAIKESFN